MFVDADRLTGVNPVPAIVESQPHTETPARHTPPRTAWSAAVDETSDEQLRKFITTTTPWIIAQVIVGKCQFVSLYRMFTLDAGALAMVALAYCLVIFASGIVYSPVSLKLGSLTSTTTGRVGIGTQDPQADLEVIFRPEYSSSDCGCRWLELRHGSVQPKQCCAWHQVKRLRCVRCVVVAVGLYG